MRQWLRKKYSVKTNRKIIDTIKSQTQKGKQVNLPIYLETKSANGKSFTYTFSFFFFPVKSEERGGGDSTSISLLSSLDWKTEKTLENV